DKEQSNTAAQENETIYAELVRKTPPLTKNREKSNIATQKDKTIYATVSSSRVSTSIPKEELIQKIRNNMFVQGCKDEIKSLSQTVYGNPDIFQKKLEEIEKNPFLGESISLQIAANPKLVANLAGKKVLGIKNRARKKAEENISSLCLAIENYAEIVKQAKENVFHVHLAEQSLHRKSIDLKQMAEDLQKPRKPGQEKAALSQKEIVRRVQSNTAVQYCHTEIVYWCIIAYGDPSVLQHRLEEVNKSPAMGEELAWQVKTHPHIFGRLAGYNVYGFKSDTRKQAENALTRLGEAIEGYAEAIKHAKEHLIQGQEEKHKRHTQPPEQDKSMQKQQSLSKSPKLPERSPTNRHQEAVETAMQTEWNRLGARPRTVTIPEKHRQESILPASHTEQKTHREQTAKNQQQSLTAEKERTPPLSHKEISDRVQNDHSVQRARIEIYNWCNIVYKDPFIFQYNTEDVQKNPVLGEELSWQVANQPTMFSSLAGKQVLGIKNSARKHAEGAVPSLCAAIDDYTKTVKKVREEIVKTHQEQSPEQDKSMQKQKSLSQSPQLPERSSIKRHLESAENSMSISSPDVQSRKVGASKAMALTS
ncbi:hypothetical protein MCO_01565, partial [Bartonella sp. DB5-6]|uniref:BID domain-containing T4SS effector n=1 Tax=Bartonella sp. DB5-6 TaxID=1094755 RepID=UPI00026E948C